MALRTDGVLVTSVANHLGSVAADQRFLSFDAHGQVPGCGLTKAGQLHCFDYAADDTVEGRSLPYLSVRDYAQYRGSVCLIQQDGAPVCVDGEGTAYGPSVADRKRFLDIETMGPTFSCAVTEQGELWCWGSQVSGGLRQVTL